MLRLLVPLVLRALAVSLLLATVLFPLGDHHALDRLGDLASGRAEDGHWLIAHHHVRPGSAHATPLERSGTAIASLFGLPNAAATFLPDVPPPDGTIATPTLGALVAGALALMAAAWRLGPHSQRPPLSAIRLVPVPPPRLPIVVAA